MHWMRILGGSAKGRVLAVPETARPTGARLRKSLFDLLQSRLPEGDFLDLYAGSGAIGLEAASRGYRVTLVEVNARAATAIDRGARGAGLRVRVLRGDAMRLLPTLGRFDVVFVDPPYEQDIPSIAAAVRGAGLLNPGGLLIVQHGHKLTLPEAEGFEREERRYGSNVLTLYTPEQEE